MAGELQDAVITALLNGDGIADQFPAGATLEIRNGTQPSSVDDAATGTVLCTITLPATPWGTPAGAAVAKNGTWQGTGSAAGTATWARLRNAADTRRVDFSVGTSGEDLNLDNTNIAVSQTVTVTGLTISGTS